MMEWKFAVKFLALFAFATDIQAVSNDCKDVIFYLFSDPSNPTQAQVIDQGSLKSFNCSNPTKFIVHGNGGTALDGPGFPGDVKDAYLSLFDVYHYNIISVDWGKLNIVPCPGGALNPICLPTAIASVETAGRCLGDFLRWLHESAMCRLKLDLVHLVGHSLGSHVCGSAAFTVTNATGELIARMTSLDPAPARLPFASLNFLRPGLAKFSDIYHTSTISFSLTKDADLILWVNGGLTPQHECLCTTYDLPAIQDCSHGKSTEYYSRSIVSGIPQATVRACESPLQFYLFPGTCQKIVYGEHCPPSTRGVYWVNNPPPETDFSC